MTERTGTDTVEQIKQKLSILDVVQPYVKLTKAGKYWRGLSPFGKEKTPSFYVSPDRGSYYCFSTSQGGDHFTFIERMEGVDFKGALKILADKAGVEITAARPEDARARDRMERLREAMAHAESFFADTLTEDSAAYTYATQRGLTKETIRDWRLGYAPQSWRVLLELLSARGYSAEELRDAGLVKEADEKPGTWYDRFRNRLMFPIRDAAGRTVAFTGRTLESGDLAKYLNSPETPLYHKSDILFGMDRAKDSIRKQGYAILVEGQFDLVLLHQAGFTNTIALSGTALSATHLSLIKRYADNLMLCLDADRAGLASSARSAHAALVSGMRVKAVRIPEGKDPADIVSQEGGAKMFAELVKNSQSVIEFFLAVLAQRETDDLKLLREVEQTVVPLIAAVQSPLEQNRFVEIVARSISSTPEAVRAALARASKELPTPEARKNTSPQASQEVSGLKQRRDLILAAIQTYPDSELAERLKSEYNRIIGAPPPEEVVDERVLFEAGLIFGDTPDPGAATDLIYTFERLILQDALQHNTLALRRAEAANDADAIATLATTVHDLHQKLARL